MLESAKGSISTVERRAHLGDSIGGRIILQRKITNIAAQLSSAKLGEFDCKGFILAFDKGLHKVCWPRRERLAFR